MDAFTHPLPTIGLTVDVVVFTILDNQLQALLIRRASEPFRGQWALPGGYLQESEVSLESARRILHDKAGVGDMFLEQLFTFDELQRDPRGRVVSIAYFALVPASRLQPSDIDSTQEPTLYPVTALPELAFDHRTIIEYAITRLQAKLQYTNVAFSLLPPLFTFAQLQITYEVILGRPLDKRNFQKKFVSLDLIEQTDELTSGAKHRPARLYKFASHSPAELKKFF